MADNKHGVKQRIVLELYNPFRPAIQPTIGTDKINLEKGIYRYFKAIGMPMTTAQIMNVEDITNESPSSK